MQTLDSRALKSRHGVEDANRVLKPFDIELVCSDRNRQFAILNEYATLRVLRHGEAVFETGICEDLIEKLAEMLPESKVEHRRVSVSEDYGRDILELSVDG
ncbi:hypothetical protein [Poriferisphaera sp. WC338]|uniref:hypothetical protein n=1 Tax=Poriferisphaera sp. WC338 TaxID=3425129 RepID=UPI003D818D11